MRELRRDPVTDQWLLVCTDFDKGVPGSECPFCPGNESMTPPEIFAIRTPRTGKDDAPWLTRVVPNKYPFFQVEEELERVGAGMYDVVSGVGAHEVVIESSEHCHLADMSVEQVGKILETYRERVKDLKKDVRLRHIMIVKNHRVHPDSLVHPHSHVIALPVIPMRIEEEIQGTREYRKRKDRCIFCDIIREERRTRSRLVWENDECVIIVPFAARYSYEMWILPRVHQPDLCSPGIELAPLAEALREAIARMRETLGDIPYSLIVHQSPNPPYFAMEYHLHIEIRPLTPGGLGFEWGSGFFVAYQSPEQAAKELREVTLSD